jgi:hypothetical protein
MKPTLQTNTKESGPLLDVASVAMPVFNQSKGRSFSQYSIQTEGTN